MDRPVMNPVFEPHALSPIRRWVGWLNLALCVPRWCGGILFFNVLGTRAARTVEAGQATGRVLKGVFYRLLFLPVLLSLMAAALVYSGTHPPVVASAMDPTWRGIYYDPVNFVSEDHTKLDAWLIPVLDAQRVIAERDNALTERHPAIVLIHDFGGSRDQMLPLAAPLHEAGYVVLVLALRGSSMDGAAGSTFGLNESGDVKAAVDVLRKTAFVDSKRIAVLGLGAGATAGLLAAQRDTGIAALVLDRPLHSFDEVLREHISPLPAWLMFVSPFCQWTFEAAYGVNASDINLKHSMSQLQNRPSLVYDAPAITCLRVEKIPQIVAFLNASMKK